MEKHIQQTSQHGNMEKDPNEWITGDEPMTGAQKSYPSTLCEELDETMSKADASKRIEELQQKTGRGANRKH